MDATRHSPEPFGEAILLGIFESYTAEKCILVEYMDARGPSNGLMPA